MSIPKFLIPLTIWMIISIFVIAYGISSSTENFENKQVDLNLIQSASVFICPLH